MENQHRKIAGYRDLSQTEIDLMNEIKAHERAGLALVDRVKQHVAGQANDAARQTLSEDEAEAARGEAERERLGAAEPGRWASIAKTDIQTATMALVRAVAQPAG